MRTEITLQLGVDPEFVLVNPEGLPVPAHQAGVAARAKGAKPLFFRDGYNVEVNLSKPYNCRGLLFNEFKKTIAGLQEQFKGKYTLASIPAYRIRSKDLIEAPPDVMEFGCSPSRNAYLNGEEGVPDLDPVTHKYRYSGGHMHFATPGATLNPNVPLTNPASHPQIVKWLDYYVGLAMTYLFDRPEQYKRRRYYGRAGEYRSQTYGGASLGVEYRTPGPEVFNHQAFFSLFMGVGQKVIYERGADPVALTKGWDAAIEAPLQLAINTGEGLEELLKPIVVNSFYNFATLKKLKEVLGDRRFAFHPNSAFRSSDSHVAWGEYAKRWNLPGPHRTLGYAREAIEVL